MAATHESHPLAFWRWQLHWQALFGIVLGVLLGYLSGSAAVGDAAGLGGRWEIKLYDLVGDLFMSGLKMLVVPLVMTAIVSAIASLGQMQGFARMGGKTLLYYVCTSFVAIMIGLTLVNAIAPGERSGLSAEEAAAAVRTEGSSEATAMAELEKKTAGRGTDSVLNVFRELVPSNVLDAMARQKMLGLITFSLLFGFFITRLQERQREIMLGFFEGAYDIMIQMTFLILRFLPLGVACLIAQTSAETFAGGNVLERLTQLGMFAVTVLAGLIMHAFVVMPLILGVLARVNPMRHLQAVAPAMLTAFSTASSAATLPLTMECAEERAGASQRVTSFVLPVGATVNMDGTALYECVAVLFLAQLSGISLDFSNQLLVVVMALLTSVGVAGIPSASLVAIVIILKAVNDNLPDGAHIPLEALAIILIFDRLLDMCRTAVNVLGDTVGTVLIARSEGEHDILAEDPGARQARLRAEAG
ncbi:dicarboxylate/amino acid:cation symporter [Haliangium sp.]|uniref:dicarboxylate/amino acid:cation symporter n=1 Tax=Haliangium sp. TaxID=2663208 RepID=UPI003D0A750E